MDWFRVYHDIIDDPKILALPRTYRWHVVELLAVSSRQAQRGQLPSIKEIGIHLRLTTQKAAEVVSTLREAGFIDVNGDGVTLHIHGWEKRQFKSDNVSARTAGWRERSGERSQNVPVNGPDTETDTETDTEHKKPPYPRKRGKALFVLDPDVPAEEWAAYDEMRKAIRKPMTDHARYLAVAKLRTLAAAGYPMATVLQQSILNSWQGLFPIAADRNGKHSSKPAVCGMTDNEVDQQKRAKRAFELSQEQAEQSRLEGLARKASQ